MDDESLVQRFHLDLPLLSGVLLLCLIGLVVLYSAAGADLEFTLRQALRMGVGLAAMLCIAQVTPSRLARWSFWFYLIGLALLAIVMVVGHTGKGAQRWLDLGFIRFQPSELMKLAVPMMVAWILARENLPATLARNMAACAVIIIPVILIIEQPDLGTAMLVLFAGMSVIFIAGMSWKLLTGLFILAASAVPVLWHFLHDYQRRRVLTFLDPEQDPLGAGYHIIQSKIAIGSGGMYGKGWLNGTQSHLEFLPERTTDFIFAVFSEEFGFMGAVLLISIYLFVIARGLAIAVSAQQAYGRLLAAGLTFTFFISVFVNIGMVTGQLPVVGVPLPLISHGGTSIVTLMITFGILMSINSHRRMLSDEG
jgi:rod shape determining protein RodA